MALRRARRRSSLASAPALLLTWGGNTPKRRCGLRSTRVEMDFAYSDKVKALQGKLARFMDEQVYPNERRFRDEVEANRAKGDPCVPTKLIDELKPKPRPDGPSNLFLPPSPPSP